MIVKYDAPAEVGANGVLVGTGEITTRRQQQRTKITKNM